MKSILQNLKSFFKNTFPLHLNRRVVELEDALLDVQLLLQHRIDENGSLALVNNEYRRQCMYLDRLTHHQAMEINDLLKKLDEIYMHQAAPLRDWPLKASAEVIHSTHFNAVDVRVEPMTFRLSLDLPGYLKGEFAKVAALCAARAYAKAAYEAVTEQLTKSKP